MSKKAKQVKNRFTVYVYLRVSSDEHAEDAYCLELQLEKCWELCNERGCGVLPSHAG
jgi:DNA invertase Pin-like site-specific DNA recombinase